MLIYSFVMMIILFHLESELKLPVQQNMFCSSVVLKRVSLNDGKDFICRSIMGIYCTLDV